METFKQNLLTNWNFMRWFRHIVGAYLLVQAFMMHDNLPGFFGAFFVFQAITNTGCCGTQGCSVPTKETNLAKTEEVEFEEIKSK